MRMRRIAVSGAVVLGLVACSGDNSSVTEIENPPQEVVSIYDLGKCTDSRRGEVIFVEEDEQEYLCYSGKWIPESEWGASRKKGSSSSEKNASSEKAKSSSSVKSGSSSSKDKSSSSADSSSAKSSSGKAPDSSSVESSSSNPSGNENEFVDSRDGTSYKITKIGSQTWFAENVRYKGDDVTVYCHSDKSENCDKYAMLYGWDDAKKACPPGSHLPTIEELRELMDFVGEDSSAVVLMADTGWTRDDGFLGTDEYGFAMLPGSYKAGKKSYGSSLGWSAQMWTASDSAGLVFAAYFGWNLPYISIGAYDLADGWGMSVRCITGEPKPSSSSSAKSSSSSVKSSSSSVKSSSSSAKSSSSSVKSSSSSAKSSSSSVKSSSSSAKSSSSSVKSSSSSAESSSSSVKSSSSSVKSSSSEKSSWKFLNPSISYGEMIDNRDGQVYKTVVIDNHTWMAENLNFETANSYCYNDTAKYCATYGRMYTWSAAQNACPEGWHLPSYDEVYILTGPDLSGYTRTADQLRSKVGWIPLNGDDTPGLDTYGFSASPGGRRIASGQYDALGTEVGYWFYIESSDYIIYDWVMEFHQDDRYSMLKRENEGWAYSIRCIKNDN